MSVDYEYNFTDGLYRARIKTTYKRSDMSMNDYIYSRPYKFESVVLPHEIITLRDVFTNGQYAIFRFNKPIIEYNDIKLHYAIQGEYQSYKEITSDMLCRYTPYQQPTIYAYEVILDNLIPETEYEFWLTYNIYKSESVFVTTTIRTNIFDYQTQKTQLQKVGVYNGQTYGPYGTFTPNDSEQSFSLSGNYNDVYNQSYQAGGSYDIWNKIIPDRLGYSHIVLLCKGNVIEGEDSQATLRLMMFLGNRSSNQFYKSLDTRQPYSNFGNDKDYCIAFNIAGYSSNDIITLRYGFEKSSNSNWLTVKYKDIKIWFE